MSDENLSIDKIIKHWVDTSDEDFNTMMTLYNSKSYGWSLFLGHISTEKLLKALYVKRFKEHAPFTHNLYRLAELIEIKLSDEYSDWLDKITSFNLTPDMMITKGSFIHCVRLTLQKNGLKKLKLSGHG